MADSPKIAPETIDRYPDATGPPGPHTDAELAGLVHLATSLGAGIVTVGHGRHPASRDAATAFTTAWQAQGGQIAEVVDWPAVAASWQRPARRLTAATPDVWVIADAPAGWAQVARRLRTCPGWDPRRTLGFASLGTITTVELAGPGILAGMSGVAATGGTWRFAGRAIARTELLHGSAP